MLFALLISKDVCQTQTLFSWITASAADAAAVVNPNDIKMLLANNFNTFF